MKPSLLSVTHVAKSFGGIAALKDVTFELSAGETLALVGENGAGKSTLMKILSGVWPQGSYEGQVAFDGKPLQVNSPLEARRAGISIIHQELCLFPKLSVAENLFLTEDAPYDGTPSSKMLRRVPWRQMFEKASELLADLGFDIDARARVGDLSVAQRQMVEIAKAVHHQARLLILDEPTSALSDREVRQLFAVLDRLKGAGVTLIYISHKLDEIFSLATRIVVLRDGTAVADKPVAETTPEEVVRWMVGRPILDKQYFSGATPTADKLLEVSNLTHRDPWGETKLLGISFDLRPGEVLGIAGLMGSGRSELLRSLVGALPGSREGSVRYHGKPVHWNSIIEAMNDGVSFVPEDRKKEGLFLDLGVGFNFTVSILDSLVNRVKWIDFDREKQRIEELRRHLRVKFADATQPIKSLSGGNQQKVLLGKMVARSPKLLMLDEPTRGIDVGAKGEIYEVIGELAKSGVGVIVVSSELPEILALCHRVLVLREGRCVADLANRGLTQETILTHAARAGAGAAPSGGSTLNEVPV